MTRRRLLWAGAVLLALLAVAGLAWLLVPPDPVTRIRAGMTLQEVEALLGAQGRRMWDYGLEAPTEFAWAGGVGAWRLSSSKVRSPAGHSLTWRRVDGAPAHPCHPWPASAPGSAGDGWGQGGQDGG
jgi:hypothetical protein